MGRKRSRRRASRSSNDAAAAGKHQRQDQTPGRGISKSEGRPSVGPDARTSLHEHADPQPSAASSPQVGNEGVERPGAGQPGAASKWKKALAGALTPPTVISGLISGVPAAVVSLFQQSSPPAASASQNLPRRPPPPVRPPSAGGEYLFSKEWKDFVGPDNANLSAAEELALSVVELANQFAGDRNLTSEFKYILIQQVLIGSGGITPAKAADLLQKRSSTASPLLDSLTRMIHAWA